MGNGNAPTLQSMCFCEENCRQTYTDWTAVSPETTETGVADLFYTVLFNGITVHHLRYKLCEDAANTTKVRGTNVRGGGVYVNAAGLFTL